VRAYGGSAWTTLRKVQLISALPSLFAALKIAAPAAFLGAILAEYLGSGGDSTLGRALIAAQTQSDAPLLWYLALISGIISGLGYLLVGLVARLVTRRGPPAPTSRWGCDDGDDRRPGRPGHGRPARLRGRRGGPPDRARAARDRDRGAGGAVGRAARRVRRVSAFVGKSPLAVWQYLFADAPPRGVRPASLSAPDARAASFGALGTTW
jgi:Binding-protein-dependent transport system inner membrane component